MALLLVSLLFQELEYDRPSLIHNFAENFFACFYNDNEGLPVTVNSLYTVKNEVL